MAEATQVYEGFITQDEMPLSFAVCEEIIASNQQFADLPEEERTTAAAISQLQQTTSAVLRGMARLELAVNMHAGDAFTGRQQLGSMTVDKK